MFTHFDDAARLAMRLADQEARRLRHDCLGTEHLLLGLLQLHDCVAARVLARADIGLEGVRAEVEKIVPPGADGAGEGRLPLTAGLQKAIDCATAAADRLGHARVGTGHLLLGLLEEARGVAFHVLFQQGIGRLGGNLSRVAERVTVEMKGILPPPSAVEDDLFAELEGRGRRAYPGLSPKAPTASIPVANRAGRPGPSKRTRSRVSAPLSAAIKGVFTAIVLLPVGVWLVAMFCRAVFWFEDTWGKAETVALAGLILSVWSTCLAFSNLRRLGWWQPKRGRPRC
jgi:hypothetical protein